MIDLDLMDSVLAALPPSARLVLLGDKDQLASVDAGAVLGDLCSDAELGLYSAATIDWLSASAGEIVRAPDLQTADGQGDPLAQQTVMLRYSRRFDANQGIGRLARLVNEKNAGQARLLLDDLPEQLFDLKLRSEQDSALGKLIIDGHPAAKDTPPGYRHYLTQLHSKRPAASNGWDSDVWALWAGNVLSAFDEFRLLCALRAGPWGVEGLNQRVAADLKRQGLISQDQGWYEGRPVLVTRNDYGLGLMNGDIGIALNLPLPDVDIPGQSKLRVAFARNDGSGGVRFVLPSRLTEIETVFAMTVHKAQGSEFEHTALLLPPQRSPVLTRELIYTGITRAQRVFTLLTSSDGIWQVAITQRVQRASGLRQALDRLTHL